MPLLIIVLLAIVVLTSSNSIKQAEANQNYEKQARRITNAQLEFFIYHNFKRHGELPEDAVLHTRRRMKDMGFDPCIPDEVYNGEKTLKLSTVGKYDAYYVQKRKKAVLEPIEQYCKEHKIEFSVSPLYVDSRVYDDFPIKNVKEFKSKYVRDKYVVLKEGDIVEYLKCGYCKVMNVNHMEKTYVMKQLRADEEFTVPFNDDSIMVEVDEEFYFTDTRN